MSKSSRFMTGLSVAGFALLSLLLPACAGATPESDDTDEPEESVGTTQQELSLLPVKCDRLTFKVALAQGQPATYNIAAWLCGRGSIDNRVIQVLVHGSTYSHYYWDFPYKPAQYSYVHAATLAGYATLNFDRIGIGESDHPPALDVTIPSNAFVLHQMVQKLRSNTLQTPSFGRVKGKRIVTVGHSLGSAIATQEAGTWHDVDGVIISGFINNFGPAQAELGTAFIPPQFDPRFAGRTFPDGYLTTAPGRRDVFYNTAYAEPAVIAKDEATKETCTIGEITPGAGGTYVGSAAIDVPVLSVIGDNDRLFCTDPSCTASGNIANEKNFYSPEAHVQVIAIPKSGHDLNLQVQAPAFYAVALAWSALNMGIDTRLPPPIRH